MVAERTDGRLRVRFVKMDKPALVGEWVTTECVSGDGPALVGEWVTTECVSWDVL